MLSKIVIVFLLAMVAIAMIGKAFAKPDARRKPGKTLTAGKCPRCGRFRIGTGPCDCETKR